MPKTKTDPKPKTESRVWYYAGRRLSGRKIVHAWYDPESR